MFCVYTLRYQMQSPAHDVNSYLTSLNDEFVYLIANDNNVCILGAIHYVNYVIAPFSRVFLVLMNMSVVLHA